uniref:Putative secretory peptide-35 n=1 Tax=Pleurobrachia bachei TaxID=34499 RepID=M4H1W1_PLEBA|nr:putative secretory peptide-35 [Pleurobrachia bachei]|eukprot:sb/3476251/
MIRFVFVLTALVLLLPPCTEGKCVFGDWDCWEHPDAPDQPLWRCSYGCYKGYCGSQCNGISGILIPEHICSATKEWCWLRGSDPDVHPWQPYYEPCEKNSDCKKLMDDEADCDGICAAF